MDTPEAYMNSNRDDEEMERDIREFMEVILDEEDETEYTDYRKYFVYDMEIISRQGDSEIISDLSKNRVLQATEKNRRRISLFWPQACCSVTQGRPAAPVWLL